MTKREKGNINSNIFSKKIKKKINPCFHPTIKAKRYLRKYI